MVGAVNFYLDRLHACHEVAEHIADDLPEIDPQCRLSGFYAGADVGNDRFRTAGALFFEWIR